MVHYNHYLKELGIKETDFPFEKEDVVEPNRYDADEEGFRPAEFWSLDYTLALYIYSHLCYFRDYCLVGGPMGMDFKEWKHIIDEMIEGFKLYIIEDNTHTDYTLTEEQRHKVSKRRCRKINKGFRNFIKYFGHLWY